jgi:NADPH:quinone reductase-like Zn-dependent oxidoreductase
LKAVVHHDHGDVDVLRVEDVPEPLIGAGDVLVAVRATSVNRLDVFQRRGPPLVPGFSLPHIAGLDIAGDVVDVGESVTTIRMGARVLVDPSLECGVCPWCRSGRDRFCPNVRVLGGNHPGGYAQLCAVPATHVYLLPPEVGYAEAAAVPTTWSTAWKGLVGIGALRVGETVVVHAAGSGVSVAAIQIAKRAGATVVATARSPEKLARAEKLGADFTLDNRTDDVESAVKSVTGGIGADMVFDHVGPALFEESLRSLRPGGRLVFCGSTTGEQATLDLPFAYQRGISLLGVAPYSHGEFAEMLDFYWKGDFDPVVDSELPLEDAPEAQRRMENGEIVGKIILHP